MGLPGSQLEYVTGLTPFIAEGFADRRYRADENTDADQPNAFVSDPDEAVQQAKRLLQNYGVQTLCVHGDDPEALAFVKALRLALEREGYSIKAFELDSPA